MSNPQAPRAVLDRLLTESSSDSRREKLLALDALCREHAASGAHDFSVPTIGALCTAQNVLSGRSLHNKPSAPFRELIAAWAHHAEAESLGPANKVPKEHPDALLLQLLAKSATTQRKRNLREVHEICRTRHAEGSLDFSVPAIGALCEQKGVLAGHSFQSKGFADFRLLLDAWGRFARPWLSAPAEAAGTRKQKQRDVELSWVARDYPELATWRELAVEWLKDAPAGLGHRMAALSLFFKDYLLRPDVPIALDQFFARGMVLPDFRKAACSAKSADVPYTNAVSGFLGWVLLKQFSEVADDGSRVVSPAFRNPVGTVSRSGAPALDESVRSPLPYGYLDELRHILAQGPNFQDWTFAQAALGAGLGELGAPGRDWFDVEEEHLDRADPDCVWRTRTRKGAPVLQMWSPVRWVALLVKLLLPLRTTQVRVLDSGESDTWQYVDGAWQLNDGPLVAVRKSKPWAQGVFRKRADPLDPSKVSTVLYVNTNKTADSGREGAAKGYVVPWYAASTPVENVFYWLEKLRNWQAKYNPLKRRTPWRELDARHISLKSEEQLASYPDACFLFRLAEGAVGERNLPVSDGVVSAAWPKVLEELERRLAQRGEVHAEGSPIRFVSRDEAGRATTDFPLHSLRVSLVTALALDGEVPFPILQKLVGHSRLLMTLYYTKPGAARIDAVLNAAAERLDAKKEQGISEFLLNTEHARLIETAVCNSTASLAMSIPEHPAARNAAGWMPMHHGLCLVGGNTSEIEDNRKVGGCYNGGASMGSGSKLLYGPVPGGSRNCVRCRWFVTEPHHLPALAAHFNTVAYHFDEARNKTMAAEQALQLLKRLKARHDTEAPGPFEHAASLRQAERTWEASLKRFSDLAEDLVACWKLIERCQRALAAEGQGQQLIVPGSAGEIQAVFEETESELLQLSGVCESLALYPDLEADKAIIRRSQLLDSALYNEGLPPLFMRLSEQEQLSAGNAFIARLAQQVAAPNPALARRQVIALMDAGKRLHEHLGLDVTETLSCALRRPPQLLQPLPPKAQK